MQWQLNCFIENFDELNLQIKRTQKNVVKFHYFGYVLNVPNAIKYAMDCMKY